MDRLTYINSGNADYIDSLYAAYQQDAGSIEFGWQKFFEGFDFRISLESPGNPPEDTVATTVLQKEINVLNLISDYRSRGHLFAKTNPVRSRREFF